MDLELIVLFLSVSLILVIPWILHDVRFVMLVPLAFLVVPGLFGVLLKATSEFIAILAEARRKEETRGATNLGLGKRTRTRMARKTLLASTSELICF